MDHPVLFVVVHGDGTRPGPSVYHFGVARGLAASGPPGSIAVAMIRPGYEGERGQVSEGSSNGHRDNYTATNIGIMADAISTLRRQYGASRVVGVGHSGGAATLGIIMGRYPHVLDAAVLVSCPCDVARWRGTRGGAWPASLSPSGFAAGIPDDARLALISGADDSNTAPALAQDFAQSLSARGVGATFVLVPGADHNGVFRSPEVVAAAEQLARR